MYDLVAAVRDEASDEMSRSIWSDFRGELLPRLESLDRDHFDRDELIRELHALRGTSRVASSKNDTRASKKQGYVAS